MNTSYHTNNNAWDYPSELKVLHIIGEIFFFNTVLVKEIHFEASFFCVYILHGGHVKSYYYYLSVFLWYVLYIFGYDMYCILFGIWLKNV